MRAVRRFQGGEAVEAGGRRPGRIWQLPPGSDAERRDVRDAVIAMLAGEVPFITLTAAEIADAFGLTRRQVSNILAAVRSALEDAGR